MPHLFLPALPSLKHRGSQRGKRRIGGHHTVTQSGAKWPENLLPSLSGTSVLDTVIHVREMSGNDAYGDTGTGIEPLP